MFWSQRHCMRMGLVNTKHYTLRRHNCPESGVRVHYPVFHLALQLLGNPLTLVINFHWTNHITKCFSWITPINPHNSLTRPTLSLLPPLYWWGNRPRFEISSDFTAQASNLIHISSKAVCAFSYFIVILFYPTSGTLWNSNGSHVNVPSRKEK